MESLFNKLESYAPIFLRLALGAVFIFHGQAKLFGGLSGTARFFDNLGLAPAMPLAVLVAVVETFGGLFLVLGLFTRYATILLAINMVVAMVSYKIPRVGFAPGGGTGWEFDLVLLAGALSLLFSGSRQWSLDSVLFKRAMPGN